MKKKDYYEILGTGKNASKEEIKRAYKRLAKQYHPDLNKESGSSEKFKEISEAYAVLSDPKKKAQYDQFGHAGFDQRFSQEDIFRGADFSDIFSEIFGNGFSSGDFGFSSSTGGFSGSIFDIFFGGHGRARKRGSDLRYDIDITLEEAANGAKKTLYFEKYEKCAHCSGTGAEDKKLTICEHCNGTGQYRKTQRTPFGLFSHSSPCRYCNSTGRIAVKKCKKCDGNGKNYAQKTLNVSIPAGVDEEARIRLSEEGEYSENGSGDLYIFIHIKDSKIFERQGPDLYTSTKLTFVQAALGSGIEVPTLDGTAELKIPAGTQPGTMFRLKNKGMPRLNSQTCGDLFVRISIEVPEKLSKRQKELIEELAKEEREKKSFFQKISEAFL